MTSSPRKSTKQIGTLFIQNIDFPPMKPEPNAFTKCRQIPHFFSAVFFSFVSF